MLFGRAGERYTYSNDVKKQWESSLSSNKILDLLGTQNIPEFNYPDVVRLLGTLTADEQTLSQKYKEFYKDLSVLLSTIPPKSNGVDRDLAETILDFRSIYNHVKRPLRVLDIGPGAGRHMAALFMNEATRPVLYAGIESIGLPYSLQNMGAALMKIKGLAPRVYDHIDYEFTWETFPDVNHLEEGAIVHLPLWQEEHLPDHFFDLVICSYILDEIPAEDLPKIAGIIGRCLSKDGIAYCRGSQHRAMLKDLYLYGCGDFHGLDITKTMLGQGLKVFSCDITASQMTRIFVQDGHPSLNDVKGPFIHHDNDVSLITDLQESYIKTEVQDIIASGKTVVVWGDPDSEYTHFKNYIEPHTQGMTILGLTHRFAENPCKVLNMTHDAPERMLAQKPDVVIIASMRDKSILRQMREMAEPGEYTLVRKFNYPIAFAFRDIK